MDAGVWATLALALALLVCSSSAVVTKLQKYNVKAEETSVSGLSSGGYMAVQFHVAFSGTIRGAGITAGGPFYCAEGLSVQAFSACSVAPVLIDVSELVSLTRLDAQLGYIDSTSYMEDSRVFLLSGTKDTVIVQGVMDKLHDYYSHFIKAENIGQEFSIPAGHGQISDEYGSWCGTFIVFLPYIINCDYPSAFMMLQHIYGDIKYADSSKFITDNFMEFSQSEFFDGFPIWSHMDTVGYVYVPSACQNGESCRLHIVFHGCLQDRGTIGDVFALHAGYNGVAEVNNIIVLYPQVQKNLFINPQGCWDWWGYSGVLYGVKAGRQMAGVKLMLDRITE